ncbi:MAG: SUF system NifU family Fe-S cluster assembly protein [Xanthomonadales bacterium]|nr:SUF system NifU family Fe-S cluster assembly protein [Gammaproteobacteria bacterium]MBT8054410.1 SUF system NifU family Fe-S cluster assembly protein [Gammaproteobacteria bacterium]NND56778.1 SUF system NifU family Fe-S cluster assembly protein [Xanthomonadales bacterium]NNK51121.1 SUF system NifU family Fe-S cluster assembly protein [Xanthomonadales bacterium]
MKDLTRLYRDTIRQHAADPAGFRREIGATHENELDNPLCGDRIRLQLRIAEDRVEAAAFDGEACAICMASASLLCQTVPGHPVSYLVRRREELVAVLNGRGEMNDSDTLKPLLGVRAYPSRIRCATLPWAAAVEAL